MNLIENKLLQKLTYQFQHSPSQINSLLESDAELIRLPSGEILAITIDSIVEEINTGMYDDPYMIGWMTVIVSLSDLSAVGAKPLGLVISQNLPDDFSETVLTQLQKGIQDACKISGTFILGGDTNSGQQLQTSSAAIGIIENGKVISRKGSQVDDLLFVSGKMGLGGAYAFEKLFMGGNSSVEYQPKARLQEGQIIRKFGSACIDTSDAFFPALSNLIELNEIGFELSVSFKNWISSSGLILAEKTSIPSWFFLAGPHGEFELLFTIPNSNKESFLKAAKAINWSPIQIGRAIKEHKVWLNSSNELKEIFPFTISNLFTECGSNPELYFESLQKLQNEWQL
jgi:thiamine-monophosphate kinase